LEAEFVELADLQGECSESKSRRKKLKIGESVRKKNSTARAKGMGCDSFLSLAFCAKRPAVELPVLRDLWLKSAPPPRRTRTRECDRKLQQP
jgi:hypothetical protein